MTHYQVDLSPSPKNPASQGSLDETLVAGNSIQRTAYFEVVKDLERKVVRPNDGTYVNDNPIDNGTLTSLGFIKDTTTYNFRVIDNSGDDLPKKIMIWLKNRATPITSWIPWQTFVFPSESVKAFNFSTTGFEIHVIHRGRLLTPIVGVNNTAYAVSPGYDYLLNGGPSGDPSLFKVINLTTETITVLIKKNGKTVERATLTASDIFSFEYGPTFWIHGTSNLNENLAVDDVNTEIALIGVTSCDIVMDDSYEFSLENIT